MQLERLYIGDFGIFSNQHLNQLGSNIVVIGGLNRAGKTTLLKVLRYLAYGIPRNKSIPPAKSKYIIEADLKLNSQARYNLKLNNYAEPELNPIGDGEKLNIREVYNNLDQFTYQQLFTISLDELKQIDENSSKIQSILLGSGLSDVVSAQHIVEKLNKAADDIGGKRGDPNVYKFKPYNSQIREGKELRKKASEQVDLYYKNKLKLKDIMKRIDKGEEEIEFTKAKIFLLDLLKSNFKDYQEYKKLGSMLNEHPGRNLNDKYNSINLREAISLKDKYLKIVEECRERDHSFKQIVDSNDIEAIKSKLLELEEEINYYYEQLSGIEQRVNNYLETRELCRKEEEALSLRLNQLNEAWDGNFSKIIELETDKISEDDLNNLISHYKELNNKYQRLAGDLKDIKTDKRLFQQQIQQLNNEGLANNIKPYNFTTITLIVLGSIISAFNLWLGIAIILVGASSVGVYLLITNYHNNAELRLSKEIELNLNNTIDKINIKEEYLEDIEAEIYNLDLELDKYRKLLNIKKDASLDLIKDYFRQVKELKYKVIEWQNKMNNLRKKESDLQWELGKAVELFGTLWSKIYNRRLEIRKLISKSRLFCSRVKDLKKYLDLAKECAKVKSDKLGVEDQIQDLLDLELDSEDYLESLERFISACKEYDDFLKFSQQKEQFKLNILATLRSNKIKFALEKVLRVEVNNNLLDLFDNYFRAYISIEEVQEDYDKYRDRLSSLKGQVEELKNNRQSLADKLKELSATEKLEAAQYKIDQARDKLQPLAEDFAINRAAAFILNKVRQNFINRAKDELLESSSQVLRELTSEEYMRMLPQDKISKNDFKLELKNGSSQSSTSILSRATKEQVFLAARLSRIKDINSSLPIIIDDAFVNFDTYHLAKTVELLTELSVNQQIFILTCHPLLIQYIAEKGNNIQYWKLESAKINLTTKGDLIDYLSK
ncbi:ATP-binding protein [Orenia marismortui]|uniref:Uncharacterized protein YhaN n=1 Tax=Orenia marismortui TaxID=46469 RepID=A0A4V3GYK2_9FIRM|nr:AAA family ATPase [Orenia marismortui]TDX52675.1 uncharacterized protein YhaN [Orenia marismortui]